MQFSSIWKMAFRCETGLELSSTPTLKRSSTAEGSPGTSATRVSRDDRDLEISVVNALRREIHREFVHREAGGK